MNSVHTRHRPDAERVFTRIDGAKPSALCARFARAARLAISISNLSFCLSPPTYIT